LLLSQPLLPSPHSKNTRLLPSTALHSSPHPLSRASCPAPLPPHLRQGAHQRFFRQLVMGGKVDALVDMAQAALDAGQCVIIGL
jgi:hypothetical protein